MFSAGKPPPDGLRHGSVGMERPEGIEAGTLKLAGTDENVIYNAFTELLDNRSIYDAMSYASERIADIIEFEYTDR